MYNSVEDFFKAEHPDLAEMLDNGGAFWPKVKDNSISNATLAGNYAIARPGGAVHSACAAMMSARLTGKIQNIG